MKQSNQQELSRQWIEVTLSEAAPVWKYDFQVEELTRMVLQGNRFWFDVYVVEGNVTARPGTWRVTLRCASDEVAGVLNENILSGDIKELAINESVTGIMVFTGETAVCRGFSEDEVRDTFSSSDRTIRRLESRPDGMTVYFVEAP